MIYITLDSGIIIPPELSSRQVMSKAWAHTPASSTHPPHERLVDTLTLLCEMVAEREGEDLVI